MSDESELQQIVANEAAAGRQDAPLNRGRGKG